MRKADLQPPLGYPGGSCFLIDRIQEEVKEPRLEEALVKKIEQGVDLTNPEAAKVYDLETERGVGPLKRLLIGPHTQYRMDWRSVTVPQVRVAIGSFLKQFYDWKAQNAWQYKHYADLLTRGEPIEWTDPKLHLTVVFAVPGGRKDTAKLVTTYWKGEPDPKAPGHGRCLLAEYRPPASELPGAQTFVHDPDGKSPHDTDTSESSNSSGGGGGYPEQGLPTPPWMHHKPMGKPFFNGPGWSGTSVDEKNLHEDKARTQGKPGGDEVEPEPARSGPKRRPVEAGMPPNPPFPGGNREHEQGGQAKRYHHRYYQKNKGKIRMKMRKWYRRMEPRMMYQKDQDRRDKYPEKFDRRPPKYRSNAERSEDWRAENKEAARQHKQHGIARTKAHQYYVRHRNEAKIHARLRYRKLKNNSTFKRKQHLRQQHPERFRRITAAKGIAPSIAFVIGSNLDLGFIHSVSQMSGTVTFFRENLALNTAELGSLPLEEFLGQVVFLSDEDVDAAFKLFDDELGYTPEEAEAVELTEKVAGRYSEMLYEKHKPDSPPDQYYDRGGNWLRWKHHDPSGAPADNQQVVYENPGSAKVIPQNHDFQNNGDQHGPPYEPYQKNAAKIADIFGGCSPELFKSAQEVTPVLSRTDQRNNLWLFDVQGKTGTYRVRVKTLPKGNVSSPSKVDVLLSCSCPYWQWQGPEHWAEQEKYLYGKPRGTASKPVIKDPDAQHHACKHVIAVLQKVLTYQGVPKLKKADGLQYLADRIASGVVQVVSEEEMRVGSLVARYLEGGGG